jgi:hypothetical protein
MKKIALHFMYLSLVISYLSCENQQTTFITKTFNNDYSIEIPSYMSDQEDGKWLYQDKQLRWIRVLKLNTLNSSYNEIIDNVLRNEELYQGSILQKEEVIKSENMVGLIKFYSKNNNKNPTGYKVMSYVVLAILEIEDEVIFIDAFAIGSNISKDFEKSILSIKKLDANASR